MAEIASEADIEAEKLMMDPGGPLVAVITTIYVRRQELAAGVAGFDYSIPIITTTSDMTGLIDDLLEKHKQELLDFMRSNPVPTWEWVKEPLVKQTIKVPPREE